MEVWRRQLRRAHRHGVLVKGLLRLYHQLTDALHVTRRERDHRRLDDPLVGLAE